VNFRYAICNETFQDWNHGRVCDFVAKCGYSGLEIAPFTLAPRISEVTPDQRANIRRAAEKSGLQIIGLHWLLAKTEGLHVTSADAGIRKKTSEYLAELARACRDLGGDILVFGSPLQRKIPPHVTREQAVDYAIDTIQQTLKTLEETNVRLLLEPLAPTETDFLNTCNEALQLADSIGHPLVGLHLDVKAMASESVPTPELIRRNAGKFGHFHANDPNRRGPGFGDTDFVPIFQALAESHYDGWVSVEVFDYSPDSETIAQESLKYMMACAARGTV
jgi:sugar phosphate isomerase/epimerase